MSLDFGGCTTSAGLVAWTGTDILTFNSDAACTNANGSGLLAMGSGNSVTITSAVGVTRTLTSTTANVETDSSTPTGYNTLESGGTQINCNSADCSSGAGRSVDILGIHRAEYNALGTKIFDHTINTTSNLVITGTGSSRTIALGGAIQLQHNLAFYTAAPRSLPRLRFHQVAVSRRAESCRPHFREAKLVPRH